MHFIYIYFLVAGSLCVYAQQGASNNAVVTPELINALAEEARTNNSALWAARSRITAAQQNAKSVPIWSDPEIMLGGMAADREMREEDGDIMYGVEQMLPVFGKEKAMRNAAQADVPVQETALDYEFQILRKELAAALFEAALQDELLKISQEDLLWLDTLTAGVEERYRVGNATLVELLRVQNEKSRRREQLLNDQNTRDDAYVTVNRLLNRNMHAAWAPLSLPEVANAIPLNQKVIQFALRFEPKLKAMRKEVAAAEAIVESSRKGARPDLALAVEGRQYSRTGEGRSAAVLMKLRLPWFNREKYNAAIKRDEARVEEAQHRIEDYIFETQAELHHLVAMIDNARREALLYRDEIIPRSERALESAQIAWQTGGDAFRDVLETRRMLLEARTMYFKAVTEQYKAISELVLCCGIGDLEALEMLTQGKEHLPESEGEEKPKE